MGEREGVPRPYSMTRRASLSAATRGRVLAAVLDLILEQGAEAITVQAVATRADVALRTVYNHFPSRDALLAAAWTDLATEVTAVTLRGLDLEATTPRVALRRFVDAIYRQF
jgi:TetR/AcrR family transcriptional regulator, transcriptional repressor of bet genes